MKISIVMPAYNEEKRIGRTLEAYSKHFEVLRKKKILDYEILVVINNTTDRTEEIVKKAQKSNKRIHYMNLKRGGKGYAVIEGLKDALKRSNDIIGFVDADMATPPEAFYYLIKNLGNADGAIASRYVRGSEVHPPTTFRRLVVAKGFNFMIKSVLFLPYKDTQCGAKIFRRKAIEKILPKLTLSRWAFDVDILYACKKLRLKIKELPTRWYDKEYSKLNLFQAMPGMAFAIIRLKLLNSKYLRIFVRIYDKILNRIKLKQEK
jgi:glycosyltransferase involved in cell wall biosynthesis